MFILLINLSKIIKIISHRSRTTMASMAKEMPALNQTGSDGNSVGSAGDPNSIFMMLKIAMMENLEETNTAGPRMSKMPAIPLISKALSTQIPKPDRVFHFNQPFISILPPICGCTEFSIAFINSVDWFSASLLMMLGKTLYPRRTLPLVIISLNGKSVSLVNNPL